MGGGAAVVKGGLWVGGWESGSGKGGKVEVGEESNGVSGWKGEMRNEKKTNVAEKVRLGTCGASLVALLRPSSPPPTTPPDPKAGLLFLVRLPDSPSPSLSTCPSSADSADRAVSRASSPIGSRVRGPEADVGRDRRGEGTGEVA